MSDGAPAQALDSVSAKVAAVAVKEEEGESRSESVKEEKEGEPEKNEAEGAAEDASATEMKEDGPKNDLDGAVEMKVQEKDDDSGREKEEGGEEKNEKMKEERETDQTEDEEEEVSAKMQPVPGKETLFSTIREHISSKGLEGLKLKDVREAMESKFGVELDKKMVKSCVTDVVEELKREESDSDEGEEAEDGGEESSSDEESESSDEDDAKPASKRRKTPARKRGSGGGGGFGKSLNRLSPELQEFTGSEELSRPQVVKRLWDYIKDNDLQSPDNKAVIMCDEVLKKLFKRDKMGMFKMNRYIGAHLISMKNWDAGKHEFNYAILDEPEEEGAPRKRGPAKRKRKRESSGGPRGLQKPQNLSAELQEFMGKEMAGRSEVVKALWDHIKANNLQDPSNKRNINCDGTLKNLLGQSKVTMFSMNKFISPHFIKEE